MKRRCINTDCYLHDRRIDTDQTECVACGKQLRTEADIVFDVLSDDGLADLFKRIGFDPKGQK